MNQQVIYTNEVPAALAAAMTDGAHGSVFVLTDENTRRLVPAALPHDRATLIVIRAGDGHKNLNSLQHVWQALQNGGATRQSLLINLGGGMVTDLGGMAAATFKRGLRFVNVPTTLLGAVDAAVGGKTGVNFGGLKNEIGVFAQASHVIVSSCFFHTLPVKELKSGFAEMVKHALISHTVNLDDLLDFDFTHVDDGRLLGLMQESVTVKRHIVHADPREQGLRRTLNLGHTVGHALESLAMARQLPVPHGYAVAWGLVAEGVLSHMVYKFPAGELQRLARFVRHNYGTMPITCDDYDELLRLMHHDKKSKQGEINCTLLAAIGHPHTDNIITDDDMRTALDIYRDLMGI